MGIVGKITREAWNQFGSNLGYQHGLNGNAPLSMFGSDESRRSYNTGYQAGQQAANNQAVSAIAPAIAKAGGKDNDD